MRIIARPILKDFCLIHEDAKDALDAWWSDVKFSDWSSWTDLKAQYPTASSVGNNRYVFNIKGNEYRLIVKIHFLAKVIYICFVGTHSDYDKVDARTVSYE